MQTYAFKNQLPMKSKSIQAFYELNDLNIVKRWPSYIENRKLHMKKQLN